MQTDFNKKNEDTDKNIKYCETDVEVRKKKYLNLLKNQEVIDWTMRKGRWLNVKQNNKKLQNRQQQTRGDH